MENNPFTAEFHKDGFTVKSLYRNGIAAFTTFPKKEVHKIKWYCQCLGYSAIENDIENTSYIRVRSISNPERFGYIFPMLQKKENEVIYFPMYGFITKTGRFIGRYPISENIQCHMFMEYALERNCTDDIPPKQLDELELRRRIPDLEPEELRNEIRSFRHE